jgi:flagellar FliJ protein
MHRIKTLTTLLDRETSLRDSALQECRQAQQAAQAAREQQRTLTTYREEYRARWSAQFANGGAINILQCYQGFVGRLDQAIAQQGVAVTQADFQVTAAAQRLRRRETRLATVRRLIARRQQALALQDERRAVKANDEASQRMLWARRAELADSL